MVLVYHKKSSDFIKGVSLGLEDVLFITFLALVELFGFDPISSLKLLAEPFSVPILNTCERILV